MNCPKTATYEKSFIYKGITLRNTLQEDIKAIRNIKRFRTRLMQEPGPQIQDLRLKINTPSLKRFDLDEEMLV